MKKIGYVPIFGRSPIIIMPYLGYGTRRRVRLCGRVLQDKGFRPARTADGRWRNLVAFYKRLESDEVVGFADYEFHINDVQSALREMQDLPPQPHPPGTHWYHPHCHGATHNQVASGMAGFLIIEGDVDTAINLAIAGERRLDPELKTGNK